MFNTVSYNSAAYNGLSNAIIIAILTNYITRALPIGTLDSTVYIGTNDTGGAVQANDKTIAL